MKQKLTNLAVGELATVAVFWINFFLFKKLITTTKSLISIYFSLFILSFILIQESIFWFILALCQEWGWKKFDNLKRF